LTKRETSSFSLPKGQLQIMQNIIKVEALVNDCLVKVYKLMDNEALKGRRETVLLVQIAQNLLKIQTKLENIKSHVKNPFEYSSSGNF